MSNKIMYKMGSWAVLVGGIYLCTIGACISSTTSMVLGIVAIVLGGWQLVLNTSVT